MSTTFEEHDPMCPRADMEAAWNGATCYCVLIRTLREVEAVDLERAQADDLLKRIEAQIASDEAGNRVTKGHDPLCPPGMKAAPPDRCTWCVTIRQAREEGPIP